MMKLSNMQKKLSKNETYVPAEDTFFLAEYLKNESGEKALDIGTGSGYLAKMLSLKFNLVLATDIDFFSIKKAHSLIENCICCDGASAITGKFDLIVCNLPYLPSHSIKDISVDGGKEGIVVPVNIIKTTKNLLKPNGKFLFLTSSLANCQMLVEKTKTLGFEAKIVSSKKLFFEKLIIIEAKNKSKMN